jgi:hypothetical protein
VRLESFAPPSAPDHMVASMAAAIAGHNRRSCNAGEAKFHSTSRNQTDRQHCLSSNPYLSAHDRSS